MRDFLNETFENQWIEWDGPTTWPSCSPDITPLDFLWGYIKTRVYVTLVADCDELMGRIRAGVSTVTEDMLQNT